MSRVELTKGANTALAPVGGNLPAVIIGVSWDSGALDCDICALVCGEGRKILSDGHFLFWSNLQSPDRSVFLRQQDGESIDTSRDRAQVMISLADLPEAADRVVVTLSTIVDGATLDVLRNVRVRAFNPGTGEEIASFTTDGSTLTLEACLILGEVYQHNGIWKIKAIAQGYESGLAGLGTDYGVNIG